MSIIQRRTEKGAVLIHVAFALIALLAFTSFVVDYGVMWVARRQAQNAADGAALAGAIASLQDGQTFEMIERSAQHFAANSRIWGQGNSSTNVVVTLSGPPNLPQYDAIPPCGQQPGCVRVDVYRNMPDRYTPALIRGNPLPTYFARIVGVVDQGVRATATAEVTSGNQVKCLLPFAVADRWSDGTDNQVNTAQFANDGDHLPPTSNPIQGWSSNDLYEDAVLGGVDFYNPPYVDNHTGWTVDRDYGRQLILKEGEVGQFSAGWAMKVDLPNSTGANEFLMDIKGCNPTAVSIATAEEDCTRFGENSTTTVEMAEAGCLGVSTGVSAGPTDHGVEGGGPAGPEGELGIVPDDPNAKWSNAVFLGPQGQRGGVVDAAGNPYMNSPRIRPIAVFDISNFMNKPKCRNLSGTGCVVKVSNIVGFFVEGMCDTLKNATPSRLDPGVNCDPSNAVAKKQVVGRIVTLPSAYVSGAGGVVDNAAFLTVVRLIR